MAAANHGQLPNHPAMMQQQHIGLGHDNVQAAGHREHRQQQHHLLDAARALMLLGAAVAVSTVGNPDADAAQVFLAFTTCWLLGVCLLSLVLVAGRRRFPEADRLAGAVIANAGAVLRQLFTPWN